jgi:prepilin-type N-terminal cleavage/methylation domain-containing protein
MKTAFSDDKGFTLIEIIASVLLIGVISFSIGMGVVQAINGYVFAKRNAETLQKGQSAMARIVKEFNMITSLSLCEETSLKFSTDSGTMTFLVDGTTIKLNGDILTDSLKTCNLKYYDSFNFTGSPPQPHLLLAPVMPSAVKIIDIELTLIGANNSDAVFKDRVFLRNLLN